MDSMFIYKNPSFSLLGKLSRFSGRPTNDQMHSVLEFPASQLCCLSNGYRSIKSSKLSSFLIGDVELGWSLIDAK